jgi:hypothetical protein
VRAISRPDARKRVSHSALVLSGACTEHLASLWRVQNGYRRSPISVRGLTAWADDAFRTSGKLNGPVMMMAERVVRMVLASVRCCLLEGESTAALLAG